MSEKAVKKVQYVNRDTGEFYNKMQYVDLQFNDDGYLLWSRKSNIKTFNEYKLPKEFTWSEKGKINELKHYILKDNQFLVYRSGDLIKPITCNELIKFWDSSERQCKALLKKMKKFGIIKEIKFSGLTYFAFNPLYGFKGRRLSLNVYIFFQNELRNEIPKWAIEKFAEQAEEMKLDFKIIK